jgi:hypothetical protein
MSGQPVFHCDHCGDQYLGYAGICRCGGSAERIVMEWRAANAESSVRLEAAATRFFNEDDLALFELRDALRSWLAARRMMR